MTPLQRSALLVALRGGMGLGEACRQVGVGVARVRREMAAEGAGGEGLAREVAAAVACSLA